jgi:hypothetical protein
MMAVPHARSVILKRLQHELLLGNVERLGGGWKDRIRSLPKDNLMVGILVPGGLVWQFGFWSWGAGTGVCE